MTDLKKGIFCVLIAWIFFTLLITGSRFTGALTSVPMVLLFQNPISLICLTPFMIKKGKDAFVSQKFKVILLRGIAGYLTFAFTFLAVHHTSLVNTVLLSNTSPLFIPLIIWMWRKIHIGYKLWMGLIVGFIGVGLILKPDIRLMQNLGAFYALSAAFCFSISMIAMRRLIKTEQVPTILFYHFLIGTLISLPLAMMTWNLPSYEILFQLIFLGLLSVVGQYFILLAFRFNKPSVLSPFNYSSVIYAALLQWLIYKTFPDWLSLIGILFVCAGSIMSIIYGEVAAKK